MAAVIEKLMYSFCRDTSAHGPFQIVVKCSPWREKECGCLPEKAQGPRKEHNVGRGALARAEILIGSASSALPRY